MDRDSEVVKEQDGSAIARNTAVVSGFLFLGRLAGFGREFIISRLIGTTAASDAFRFANEAILQDVYNKVEKLLQPTYLPLFVGRQRQDGDREAWRFTSIFGTLQSLLLITICVFGVIASPQIAAWLIKGAPEEVVRRLGPGSEGHRYLVFFLRVFFPALLVYSLSNLTELTLQAYNKFTMPALGESLRRILIVAAAAGAVVVFHRPTAYETTYALALGVATGIGCRLIVMIPGLWGKRRLVRPSLDVTHPTIRKVAILAAPLVVGIIFSFVRNLAEAKYGFRMGVGYYSGLKYARKIVDVPWQIVALALSYVIYPFVSELGARQDRARMADALVSMLRVIAFIFVPLTVFFLILGEPTVRVAFQGVKFDEESVRITMSALPWYLFAMVFFAVEDPLLKWFFALSDTRTPILMGIGANVIWFASAYVGIQLLGLGLPALAFSMGISKMLKVIILLAILFPRLGGARAALGPPGIGAFTGLAASLLVGLGFGVGTWAFVRLTALADRSPAWLPLAVAVAVFAASSWAVRRNATGSFLVRLAAANLVMAGVAGLCLTALAGAVPFGGLKAQAVVLFGSLAASVPAYLAVSVALRIEECFLVVDRIKQRLRRSRRSADEP
ncbi:MAG: murein biosynthesis integral membrane protein MurJ [Armatimonadota bacterium]